jgi:Ca-activated chloride channel family protein
MSFIWPPMLVLLALVPAGVLIYLSIDRRRRLAAAKSGFGTISGGPRAQAGRRGGLRTRVPAAFFLVGFTLMVLALARPQGAIGLPRTEGTVILAYDVSGSMAADDLKPTRMDAAKAATQAFVEKQPAGVVIGVVAFSDSGVSVQTPTREDSAVLAAINRLTPQRGTSLGQGIQASLAAISLAENGPQTNYYDNRVPDASPTPAPAPVQPGSHTSAVIVLLTDGENNERPDPLEVAAAAADQGIRIFTVGLGSAAGTTLDLNGFQVHTQLNEPLLKQVAAMTGGEYFLAPDADSLRSIYDNLGSRLTVKSEDIEVTALFAGASILILVSGGVLSLIWLGRLP